MERAMNPGGGRYGARPTVPVFPGNKRREAVSGESSSLVSRTLMLMEPVNRVGLPPGSEADRRNLADRSCQSAGMGSSAIEQTAACHAATRLGAACAAPDFLRIEVLNQRMLGHLCTGAAVTDAELLLHMIRCGVLFATRPGMVAVNDQALGEALWQGGESVIARALQCLPEESIVRLMGCHAGLGEECLRLRPYFFLLAPQSLKTRAVFARILPRMRPGKRDELLRRIIRSDWAQARSLAPAQQLVRAEPATVLHCAGHPQAAGLRRQAVARDVRLLPDLKEQTEAGEYQELCDLALATSGMALRYMDACDRTPERVARAVAHRNAPHIADIPVALRDEKILRQALKNASRDAYVFRTPRLGAAFFTRWNLWDTLRQKENWLGYLPKGERSQALYHAWVSEYPIRALGPDVPSILQQSHPEWTADLWQGSRFMALGDQAGGLCRMLSAPDPVAVIQDNSAVLHGLGPWPPIAKIPPWALLLEGHWSKLPQEYKDKIWRNGGTEGLGEDFHVPPFCIDPQALLDPVQNDHCTLRAAWIPGQVARKLLFCHHFRLRHQALGLALHQDIQDQVRQLEESIRTQTLPLWPMGGASSGQGWTLRGGRTLVRTDAQGCDGQGCVLHAKFQRAGEPLASFAAEQVVQQFARDHAEMGWHSEIPLPIGIFRVPLDELPADRQDFPDPLQVYKDKGQEYCLAFRFSTKDSDYDTLAWHPDQPGGDCSKARTGLLRAFHDLGLWSSLGAVHTSTIRLYHHFLETEGSRPELLLGNLFQPGQCYPGTLHLWNTRTIEQSDWGWSGLRDLGDLEFYPFITAYTGSVDARWMPHGYGQRASFVNGMAQNMLGGLLHYLCACRDQADYHYYNEAQITRLADFLEAACERYLGALLGEDIRLETVFPAGVYTQWRLLAAREMIYWTARQTLVPAEGKEGFAQHFNRDGRPSAELYPGHPRLERVHYGRGADFTEEAGENLGANNSKLPLLYLVRGLYMMAATVADRLARPVADPEVPMEA